MPKRCIAFGCSFTHYFYWPTWADFIGCNFDEYYNFAQPGASNFMMLRRFIEVQQRLKFTSDDVFLIGLTAFGRLNWLTENRLWFARGGPQNWDVTYDDCSGNPILRLAQVEFIKNKFWKEELGIYDTWLMVNNIKNILDLIGAKYHFIMALDNDYFLTSKQFDLHEKEITFFNDIKNLVENDVTLQTLADRNPVAKDTHPSPQVHFDFVQTYFPQFITEKSIEFYTEILASDFLSKNPSRVGMLKYYFAKNKNDFEPRNIFYGKYV